MCFVHCTQVKFLGWPCPTTFIFFRFETSIVTLCQHVMWQRVFRNKRLIQQFMCVGFCRRLMSPNKDETAVHCCDPVLSILVILVSRNVFHVLSSLQPTVCLNFFWLILSLVDLTLATFIAYGPLRSLVSQVDFISLLARFATRFQLKRSFWDNLIKSVGNIKSTLYHNAAMLFKKRQVIKGIKGVGF